MRVAFAVLVLLPAATFLLNLGLAVMFLFTENAIATSIVWGIGAAIHLCLIVAGVKAYKQQRQSKIERAIYRMTRY